MVRVSFSNLEEYKTATETLAVYPFIPMQHPAFLAALFCMRNYVHTTVIIEIIESTVSITITNQKRVFSERICIMAVPEKEVHECLIRILGSILSWALTNGPAIVKNPDGTFTVADDPLI